MDSKLYHYTNSFLNVLIGFMIAFFGAVILWPSPVQAVAKPAMPTQLDLGGVIWKIDVVQYPGNSMGFTAYTQCDIRHIQIKVGSDNPGESVLHEILHAYTCQDSAHDFTVENFYYNSKTENGHEGYERIGQVITDALQRNPGFAAYLAEGKK